MRFDKQNQLCAEQAFTGSATVSTNSYKKQTAAQDISIGRLYSLLLLPTVDAGAGSTHTLEAIMATDAALTTSITSLNSLSKLAAALTTSDVIEIPIPQGSLTKQYLGFRHTATSGTTTLTADVYLVPSDEIPYFKSFPRGPVAAV